MRRGPNGGRRDRAERLARPSHADAGETPMPTRVILLGGLVVLTLLVRAVLAVDAGLRVHGPMGPR